MTTLGSKLPKDDANGLPAIANALLEDPHRAHLIVMVVDCGKIVEDVDEETRIPMARIRRIEAILGADAKLGERLLRNALSARHGSQELPLDDQRDLFSLFNPGAAWEENDEGEVVLADTDEATTAAVVDIAGDLIEPAPDIVVLETEPPDDDFEAAAAKAARKQTDDRIAANHAKRKGRATPKIGDPFTVTT